MRTSAYAPHPMRADRMRTSSHAHLLQMPYDVLPSTALEAATTFAAILVALLIANLTTSSITSMLSAIDSRDSQCVTAVTNVTDVMLSVIDSRGLSAPNTPPSPLLQATG